MAKFLTITQKGFTFIVHDADKNIRDEEWTIERVAAFMSVHHTLGVKATKYAKGLTFRTAIASIMYTLQCDRPTSADLNKLTLKLVPRLCEMYEDTAKQAFLGRSLSDILDDVVIMAKEIIADAEAPLEIFGRVQTPPPFYTRPSKMEYDAELERAIAQEQAYWDKFNQYLESGQATGHRILIREGDKIYTGIIVSSSPKCVYCDVKDEYNRLLQSGARFPRNSKRFIIESFK